MTVVALDAMGGDQAPGAVVEGALLAARDRSLEIALVGRVEQLRPLIPTLPPNLQLIDAPDVVGMTEQPATSVRQKPRSSIMVGLDLVKQGDAQAFVSFGNTGAVMAASLFKLGRVPGVVRPALGAIFQNGRGKYSLLLDVGANVECRPQYLLQFGAMGKAYFERVLQHSNPSVGLLNVGEEESKGNQFVREAYRLLAAEEPNFVGNVEGNAMVRGVADIVVTDGFNGNLAIKVSEGVADLLIAQLRRAIKSKAYYMVGGAADARRVRETPRPYGLPTSGRCAPLRCQRRCDHRPRPRQCGGGRQRRALGASRWRVAVRRGDPRGSQRLDRCARRFGRSGWDGCRSHGTGRRRPGAADRRCRSWRAPLGTGPHQPVQWVGERRPAAVV